MRICKPWDDSHPTEPSGTIGSLRVSYGAKPNGSHGESFGEGKAGSFNSPHPDGLAPVGMTDYSYRSASIGSILAARRAGI